jgi:hypothetical protein
MSNPSAILFVVWMGALLVLVMFVWPRMDRQRIRENVEAHGGKVIDIDSVWLRAAGRYGRTYDVTYTSRQGRRITATCMTSMMRGVQWISDRPPGSDRVTPQVAEEPGPSEEIDCVECGAKIPAEQTRCPQCGWSYTGNFPDR